MRRHERSVTIISEAPKFLLLLDIFFFCFFQVKALVVMSSVLSGFGFWISGFYLGADV